MSAPRPAAHRAVPATVSRAVPAPVSMPAPEAVSAPDPTPIMDRAVHATSKRWRPSFLGARASRPSPRAPATNERGPAAASEARESCPSPDGSAGVRPPEDTRTVLAVPSVEAWDIYKGFGHRAVLRGVDLYVLPGRTLAIVGPNGTGKTTLLRILATLARPTSGIVRLCGSDAVRDPMAARRRLGVVFGATFLYDELTGRENLRHYARLYGVSDAGGRIAELAALVGLPGSRLDERVGAYSRGMAQRLSIARALLHRPDVLLLDEPDAGLDPAATHDLPRLLRGDTATVGAAGRAIILVTHDLDLAVALADDVAILAGGRFAYTAPTAAITPADLRRAYDEAT